jgi:hypothetical protein
MAVQVRGDLDTRNFVLHTYPGRREDQATLLQDAGRATVLAPNTLMAKVSASQKWVPFTDETAVDGSAIPQGIFVGDEIAAADLVAGDVVDQPIITFGIDFDEALLVIENSKTLDTVIATSNAAAVYSKKTVRDYLVDKTLIPRDTITISEQENV